MTLDDVKQLIGERRHVGYRVRFFRPCGPIKRGVADFFPEQHEPPFNTPVEAWDYALKFAAATQGRFYDVEMVHNVSMRSAGSQILNPSTPQQMEIPA